MKSKAIVANRVNKAIFQLHKIPNRQNVVCIFGFKPFQQIDNSYFLLWVRGVGFSSGTVHWASRNPYKIISFVIYWEDIRCES